MKLHFSWFKYFEFLAKIVIDLPIVSSKLFYLTKNQLLKKQNHYITWEKCYIALSIDFSSRTIQRCTKSNCLKSLENIIPKTNFIVLIFDTNFVKGTSTDIQNTDVWKSIVRVIKHTNFQLFRAYPVCLHNNVLGSKNYLDVIISQRNFRSFINNLYKETL